MVQVGTMVVQGGLKGDQGEPGWSRMDYSGPE